VDGSNQVMMAVEPSVTAVTFEGEDQEEDMVLNTLLP